MAFDGFIRLMNHRKRTHPSSKRCKNYVTGTCPFDNECWYVHSTEDSSDMADNFNCTICNTTFKGRNSFMKHKKDEHRDVTPSCTSFLEGKCSRTEEVCWFIHKTKNQSESSSEVFHKAPVNPIPPDHVKQLLELLTQVNLKVNSLEEKLNQEKQQNPECLSL